MARNPKSDSAISARKPTMAEIARAAGVSLPTVSKVINNRSDVAPETRARIEQVIAEQGYISNKAAQSLWTGRTNLIDLVLNHLGGDYNLEIIRGVEETLSKTSSRMVLSATQGETQQERQWLEKVINGSTDGALLVLAHEHSIHLEALRRHTIPFVVIDHQSEIGSAIPSVGATNWSGGKTATEYLISLGHRRIAMICGVSTTASAQARLAGYRAALDAAGIPIDPVLIRPGTFLFAAGYEQTNALMALPEPPTAIFSANDMQALGAYQALREHSIAVPEQMSIIGFDDEPAASLVYPALTTIYQPLEEMARIATKMLLQLIDGEALDSSRVEVATSLVIRASCAPPAKMP